MCGTELYFFCLVVMSGANTFGQWKKQCLGKVDFSKKGSVDEDIGHVVSFLNERENYFTTSSCSGRIVLVDGVPDSPDVRKQNCSWLFVSHGKCATEDVVSALRKSSGDAVLKFEPFVLHVQCKRLEDAQLLAVRSTHCLEVPLGHKGEILVSEEYICFVVSIANLKMEENLKRIDRFSQCLMAALQQEQSTCSTEGENKEKSAYKRRRRRQQRDLVRL
ncbi:tRNA wybutosine-synthesizing protein 3 homolog isoform X2 [Denticeps clupeoides]|uniref:tRNA wybutosine-synthesizing protein 3 homolog isoform X2 n=1 Tax=Denticeps clupeoides TaxID=299321 RepID=UPI0010A409A4|nr:tRNA wybutosine-synthesizing protein 3 homolog isoform X2 [Denticeps clupeoides]